ELRRRIAEWQSDIAKRDRGSAAGSRTGWAGPQLDTSDWKTMNLPTYWEAAGLPDVNGVVWFRKDIEVPASMVGKSLRLYLGTVDEGDETYVNGKRLGPPTGTRQNRHYRLPANFLKAGTNLVAVRILDTAGPGGFSGRPTDMRIECFDKSGTQTVALAGEWKYRVGLKGIARRPAHRAGSRRLGGLYNAMIAPLIPYAIKGAIWYQGEANANEAYSYRTLFPTMIRDWRDRWQQGEFPFLFVQLANYRPRVEQPGESTWAELREAQTRTLSLRNTGMAVIIDIGEADNIHPRNKLDVGKRLSLAARHVTYGEKDLVYSGPVYRKGSMKTEGRKVRLSFDCIGGGLVAKAGELKGFAIAGRERKFVPASATIDGDSVVVWSGSVKEPAAVRYGWADNPECNLYNREGLPATPFRTDNWPGITR
ncbi:MAG: sialate O-acetylesterase, partial [Planctomycetes bacterium]|nr:sialate O-acetylesterase [Planctomycetota bacterium]